LDLLNEADSFVASVAERLARGVPPAATGNVNHLPGPKAFPSLILWNLKRNWLLGKDISLCWKGAKTRLRLVLSGMRSALLVDTKFREAS
jgi:hypothetical protein